MATQLQNAENELILKNTALQIPLKNKQRLIVSALLTLLKIHFDFLNYILVKLL